MFFPTGEEIMDTSDVCIYEEQYLRSYPSSFKHIKRMIAVGDPNPDKSIIRNSRIFFTKMDWIYYFTNVIMPLIEHPFELITHNSDYNSGGIQIILDHPLLVQWRGCNMVPHPKTLGIPLSLENVDMWQRTNKEHIRKCSMNNKCRLIYFNFNNSTNPSVRAVAEKCMIDQGFIKNESKPWDEYIEELSHYKYCISPEGNGVDCHRIWECIALGVIPIVIKNPIIYEWFKGYPILWVETYEKLNVSLGNIFIQSETSDNRIEIQKLTD
tara:strand:- start:19 stop:822 length:804 start_codon:yes stop_codon:yes gene_type:complete